MEDVTCSHLPALIGTDSFLSDGILNVSSFSDNASLINKPQPNILKRRDFIPQEPIKNLPFSPSRFLNQKKLSDNLSGKIGSQEESMSISTTEDSGIEISTCDIDGLFSDPITSTPKVKKQEPRASVENSFEEESQVGESCIISGCDSVFEDRKVVSVPDKVLFRSPLIRRFINESGPRTPTPFKFRFGKNSFSKTIEECRDRPLAEPSNKISYKKKLKCGSPRAADYVCKRTARKALNLGGNYLDVHNECWNPPVQPTLPFVNQSNAYQSDLSCSWKTTLNMKHGDESAIYTSLAGSHGEITSFHASGDLVQGEHRSTKPQQPCTYLTSSEPFKDVAYLAEMNEKLVRVACGLSDDQKAMTLAAKRYLALEKTKSIKIRDCYRILPHSRRPSHRMLR